MLFKFLLAVRLCQVIHVCMCLCVCMCFVYVFVCVCVVVCAYVCIVPVMCYAQSTCGDYTPPPPLSPSSCSDHDVAITTFQLHEAFCHRNVKVCPRCKATVLAQSMEEHLKGCGSEMTPPPEAIEDHTTEEPPPTHECAVSSEDLQEVPCEVCGASFPFSCLEDHVRQCHTCEHCGVVVPDRDHREHQVCGPWSAVVVFCVLLAKNIYVLLTFTD